jgi:hypothetical protein
LKEDKDYRHMSSIHSHGLLGRRVEPNGSWTAYDVFTGRPACVAKQLMVRLTLDEATIAVLANNRSYAHRYARALSPGGETIN